MRSDMADNLLAMSDPAAPARDLGNTERAYVSGCGEGQAELANAKPKRSLDPRHCRLTYARP